jgi:hypothetical protein
MRFQMEGKLKRGGRTRFQAVFCEIARGLVAQDATQMDLADAFGVTDRTIRFWLCGEPTFRAAVLAGQRDRDERRVLAAQERYDDFVRRRAPSHRAS